MECKHTEVVERNFNSVPFKRLSVRIQPQSKPTFVVIVTSAKIRGPYCGGVGSTEVSQVKG